MLHIMRKLSTAARGGTREVLETAVDANALRILSQEIYECEINLKESKQHLANVMAEKISLKRKLDSQTKLAKQKEEEIKYQIERNDEAAALLIAEELSQLEDWTKTLDQQHEQLHNYEVKLLQTLKKTAFSLSQYKNELNIVRAHEETQKSVGKLSIHANKHSNKFSDIQESLDRLRQKHETFNDQMLAMDNIESHIRGEPNSQDLNRKRVEDVLARFKKKAS